MSDETRCCFVCAWSSTNPVLAGSHAFQSRATLTSVVQCRRFVPYPMMAHQVCGGFQHRNDFDGLPTLPWVRELDGAAP